MAHALSMHVSMRVFLLLLLVGAPFACRVFDPPNRPLDTCRRSCEAKASRQCNEGECERGCEMILDRIIEREADNVIACVAAGSRRCGDVVWADCAAHIGAHADGGPPAPGPPADEE
jgi:hypothetical protein